MKKKIFLGVGAILIITIAFFVYVALTTRSSSPADTVAAEVNDLEVTVTYCRPYKKGRLIFGNESDDALVPHGEYWRLGANDATEITFSKDVNFAGNPIPAGTYRMYAVPNADSWEVSLNSEVGEFGYFEPDYELDVTKVKVPTRVSPQEVEQFTIQLLDGNQVSSVRMEFVWDRTLVSIPISPQ